MTDRIYRVTVRTTSSWQPGSGTLWQWSVLYCGTDREEARVAYHTSTPADYWRGRGNSAQETVCEVIEDSDSDDFADDLEYETEV